MSCMLQSEPQRRERERERKKQNKTVHAREREIVMRVPREHCLPLAHTLEWDAKETGAERQKREGREIVWSLENESGNNEGRKRRRESSNDPLSLMRNSSHLSAGTK